MGEVSNNVLYPYSTPPQIAPMGKFLAWVESPVCVQSTAGREGEEHAQGQRREDPKQAALKAGCG